MFDDSGIHLDELQTNLKHVFGTDVALSPFCNTVKNMGLTCQRLKHVVLQPSEEERAKFMSQVQGVPASCFAWLSSSNTAYCPF